MASEQKHQRKNFWAYDKSEFFWMAFIYTTSMFAPRYLYCCTISIAWQWLQMKGMGKAFCWKSMIISIVFKTLMSKRDQNKSPLPSHDQGHPPWCSSRIASLRDMRPLGIIVINPHTIQFLNAFIQRTLHLFPFLYKTTRDSFATRVSMYESTAGLILFYNVVLNLTL